MLLTHFLQKYSKEKIYNFIENNNNEKIFFEMLKYYYYKMDAYNSNKACHFKLIIEKRGFILDSKNKDTKKISKDLNEDIKQKVMGYT